MLPRVNYGEKYRFQKSEDGSFTLYSKEYDECYHSIRDGAFRESLEKHVKPAFELTQKSHLRILDICFGLGFNTLSTLYHLKQQREVKSVEIFSPELDSDLLVSLRHFPYPPKLLPFKKIVIELIENGRYEENGIFVELYKGDAREYVKGLRNIDVVYQDAFSPKKNPILWTVEYFEDIAKLLDPKGLLTTYSIASPVRFALDEAGFYIYEKEIEGIKKITIASKSELPLKKVDILAKKSRSRAKPLRDKFVQEN